MAENPQNNRPTVCQSNNVPKMHVSKIPKDTKILLKHSKTGRIDGCDISLT